MEGFILRLILITPLFFHASKSYSQSFSLTDSLIAVYKFEGNAIDSTDNHNDGVVYGATLTTDRFGTPNGAYSFNGINNYIELIPGNSKFKPTKFPISVCAWVKYFGPTDNRFGSAGSVFLNDLKENHYNGVLFCITTNGTITLHYGNGGTCGESTRRSKMGTTVLDNQWHLITGVIRGPTDMDIYVDCKNDGGTYSGIGDKIAYSNSYGATGKVDVCSAGCDPFYYYKGVIDEIRFYNRELTQDDIFRLYKMSPFPFPSVSLGADVKFCNLNTVTLNPTYSNANSFLWSNGKTTSSITAGSAGEYSVTVSDSKGCKAWDTVEVSKGGGVVAGTLTALRDTICSGTPAMLSVTGNTGSINWQSSVFPDKNFSSVSGASNISFNDLPGQTSYYRVVASAGGCADTSAPYKIVVKPTPFADYTYNSSGLNLNFNSAGSSGDVTIWEWNFGDGSSISNEPNPSHHFAVKDTFHVCLTVYNGSNCSFTQCKDLDLLTGIENSNARKYTVVLYPNPAEGYTDIMVAGIASEGYELHIFNITGQQVKFQKGRMGTVTHIQWNNQPAGVYLYEVVVNREIVKRGKLMVK